MKRSKKRKSQLLTSGYPNWQAGLLIKHPPPPCLPVFLSSSSSSSLPLFFFFPLSSHCQSISS